MKSTKKLLALLLSALLLLSLLPAAFATEPGGTGTTDAEANPTTDNQKFHLTITDTYPKHVFELYQVFTGTLHTDTTQTDKGETTIRYLSDIAFGSAWTNPTGDISAIVEEFEANTADPAANWDLLVNKNNAPPTTYGTQACAEGTTTVTFSDLDAGYYIAREVTPSDVMGNVTYSSVIVQVVENVNVASKHGTASSQKKVMDTNDSVANSTTGWQDSADYDIGDDVPFQLTATVAKNIQDFKGPYALTFHDKQSTGLTFNASSVKVKIDGKLVETGYTVVTEGIDDDCTFHVKFADLRDYKEQLIHGGSVVTVEYTSKLNENAKIGSEGNPNEMHITFTNNPDSEQPEPEEDGKTPPDKVIVFTFQLDVFKHDGSNEGRPMGGAEFTLYKKNHTSGKFEFYKKIKPEEADADKSDTRYVYHFMGLDDGTYMLKETVTPRGYNTADPIEFTITADHDVTSDDPRLNSVTCKDDTNTVNFGELPTTKGIFTTLVLNYKGNTLPSTGGMGTTIFYVLGSILAVGAAILLVSKKRMNGAR